MHSDKDARLVKLANEYKRGLLTDEEYTERATIIVLEWLTTQEA